MSAHLGERLGLAAAGLLAPAEAAAVEAHLRDCAACAAEAASWRGPVDELRARPLAPVPPALAARVRAAVEGRLAARAERAWNRAALGFLVAFAWTMTVAAWFALDLVRGELALRLGTALAPTAAWYGGYVLAGWLSALAATVLLGRRGLVEGRIA
ncbi:MAG: zf-HC2 domain-containing protein [Vicinamibacteria bacterium]